PRTGGDDDRLGFDRPVVRLHADDTVAAPEEFRRGDADARDRALLAGDGRERLDGRHGIDAASAGLERADGSVADGDPGHQTTDLARLDEPRLDPDLDLHRDVALDERDVLGPLGSRQSEHTGSLEADRASGPARELRVDTEGVARHRRDLALRVVLPQD